MKIYIFESLKLINKLRQRLSNEKDLSTNLTEKDLNGLEEHLLSKLKGLEDHSDAFLSFFRDALQDSGLDPMASEDIQDLLNMTEAVIEEVPNELQNAPTPTETEVKSSIAASPIVDEMPKPIEKTVISPSINPVKIGFFDKFWAHFKDELSVNWFLFLGAFLVFGAGIVYSLMNWTSFSPIVQFVYSLSGLFFFVLMEFLLRKYLFLKKSPKVFCYLFFLGSPLVLFIQSKLGLLYFSIALIVIALSVLNISKLYSLENKQTSFLVLLLSLIYPIVYASSVCTDFIISIVIPLLSIGYLLSKPYEEIEEQEGLNKYFRSLASYYFFVIHFSLLSPVVFTWLMFVFSADYLSRPKIQLQRAGFFYSFFFLFALAAIATEQNIFLLSGSILFLINLSKMQIHSPHWLRGWMIVLLSQILVYFVPPQMFFMNYKSSMGVFIAVCFIELVGGAALARFLKLNYRIEVFAIISVCFYLLSIGFKSSLLIVPVFSLLAVLLFNFKRSLNFIESLIFYLYISSILVLDFKFISFIELNTVLAFVAFVAFYNFKIKKLNISALFVLALVYLIIAQLSILGEIYPRLSDSLYLKVLIFNSVIFWLLLKSKYHVVTLPLYLLEKQLMAFSLGWLYFKGENFLFSLALSQVIIFLLAHPKTLSLIKSKVNTNTILLASYERFLRKSLSIVCLVFVAIFWVQFTCLIPLLLLAFIYQLGALSVLMFSLVFVFGLNSLTLVSMDFLALFLTCFYLITAEFKLSKYTVYLKDWVVVFTYVAYFFSLCFVQSNSIGFKANNDFLTLFNSGYLYNFGTYWLLFLVVFYFLAKKKYHPFLLLYLCCAGGLFLSPVLMNIVGVPLFILSMVSMIIVLEILGLQIVEKHSYSLFMTGLLAFVMFNLGFSFTNAGYNPYDLYGALLLIVPIFSYLRTKETCFLDSFYLLLLIYSLFHSFFPYYVIGLALFCWAAHILKIRDAKHHMTWCSLLQVVIVISLVLLDKAPLVLGLHFCILATHVFIASYFYKIHFLVDLSFIFYGLIYLFLKDHGIVGGSVYSSYALLVLGVVLDLLTRVNSLHFFRAPFHRISRVLPLLVMFKESQSSQSPFVFLVSGGVYEWFQDTSKLSYTRLLGLLSFNLACFAFVEAYELGWEIFSSFLGFSVLWYAKSVQKYCSKEIMVLLKVTGSFLFYSGFLYEFVMVGTVYHLLFLWFACMMGGLLAIYFEGRIQLYMSTLVFVFSVGFFVIRQIIFQINMGLPAMMGLGLILMIIGVLLEKNKSFFVDRLSSLSKRFEKWSD
ncbi:MAG: hypothetical protein KC646_12785 [Candidatus Cloacimonetes bacterium]|nr:hypothetical protein [Candidatus Cloacimonadota bacterium]